jgi:phosphoglycerol transferase MdoB-like AlkP superfamily enzyme
VVFAHGIGGAKDLPIPAEYAIAGAGAALAVSFIVLALAWRTPRFDGRNGGRPAPGWLAAVVDSPVFSWTLRLLGLAFFLYVGWAAVAGPDLLVNPAFGVFYVILWVGIVPASLAFGPFYRAVNPVRTIHLLFSKATGGDPEDGLVELPRWVGYWPAALGLFAFVWFELVYPSSTYLGPLRLWVAVYVAVGVLGGAVFGSRWIAQADPFEGYSTLVGRLSFFGRREEDGALVLRGPLNNLDGVRPRPGLVGVVSVLFGSTAFDSFKDSSVWLQFSQSSSVDSTLLNTAALVAFCAIVAGSFTLATMATGVGEGIERRSLPNRFAHSVVPIIVGYIVAHYLSYFVEVGQQTLVLLSDPLARGDNLLGTADWEVNYWLSSNPTFLAVVKVLAVVTGHVLGVIAAHDRAMKLLPKRHQLTGQLPLLFVMVFYTVSGLYLLFGA